MSLFKKFAAPTDVKLEEVKDTVGGGFSVLDTDIYKGKVKMAFLDVWGSGANYVALTLALENGADYDQEGIWKFTDTVTNANTSSVTIRAVFPNPDNYLLPGCSLRPSL